MICGCRLLPSAALLWPPAAWPPDPPWREPSAGYWSICLYSFRLQCVFQRVDGVPDIVLRIAQVIERFFRSGALVARRRDVHAGGVRKILPVVHAIPFT